MNITEVLSIGQTKAQAMSIVDYIGTDPDRFKELMTLLSGDDVVIAQRAAWPLMHSAEKYPFLVKPHLMMLIEIARQPHHHPAVRRAITRILDHAELDEELEGYAYELCHDLASSVKEDVAVRCFSLGVIERTAMKYPELAPEVYPIAVQMSQSESAGMRNRGNKAVQRVSKYLP